MMEPTVCEGKVIELELNGEVLLALDMPRKPEKAKVSFSIDSIFRQFLGKMVKITIEEITS